MGDNPSREPDRCASSNLQTVLSGLLAGSGMFLVLAVFTVASGSAPQTGEEMAFLVDVAILLAVLASLAQLIFPPKSFAAARRKILEQVAEGPASGEGGPDDARERLWTQFRHTTIASAAVLEGAAFFCLVAYMMTQSLVPMALAVALMVGIAAKIPTQARADRWLDEQMELIRQQRQFKA